MVAELNVDEWADRNVVLYDADEGMAALKTEQPVEIAHAMYAKIDLLARKEPKNGRSMDAVRDLMAHPGTLFTGC